MSLTEFHVLPDDVKLLIETVLFSLHSEFPEPSINKKTKTLKILKKLLFVKVIAFLTKYRKTKQ